MTIFITIVTLNHIAVKVLFAQHILRKRLASFLGSNLDKL